MKNTRTLSWIVGGTFTGFIAFGIIGMVAQMDVIVRTPGELRPVKYADVRPPIEGIVLEVYKTEGDKVKAGEPIARMDSRTEELEREKLHREDDRLSGDLKDRVRKRAECAAKLELSKSAVKVAEAEVESGKARLQQALSSLKQAEAVPDAIEFRNAEERLHQQEIAVKDAEKAFEDDKLLFDKGMVSQQNLNKAESALATAQSELRVRTNAIEIHKKTRFGADLDKAKAEAAGQKAALDGALARLEERRSEQKLCELAGQDESETRRLEAELAKNRLAEDRLTRAIGEKTLTAPIDGILYDFHVKPGQTITHKERTAWVFDVSGFLFYGRAQQMDLSNIEAGQPALLYFDALPYRLEGTWDATVGVASQIAAPPSGSSGESVLQLPGVQDNHPQALVILEVKPGDPRNSKLRVGFTGYAEITTGRASLIEVLLGRTTSPSKK